MKKVQHGFTLIELVMVIVVLGVLAAVAIPKFVDLKGDARQAALDGVAGALSSASTINYAARSVKVDNTKNSAVAKCEDTAALLAGGLPVAEYTITAGTTGSTGSTDVLPDISKSDCKLKTVSTPVLTKDFTAIGIL